MSIPVEDQLKSLSDSLTDMWIAGLENSVFQDIHVSALIRMGEDAIPRLQFYLTSQAELERELVADLEKYYMDKRELEMEYKEIVTSPTVPQWRGSNENADALTLNISKMEAIDLIFVKRWGGSPDAITGFSNPEGCPSRTGVAGALWVLESIRSPIVIPLLKELVEQAESIERKSLLNGYCSVFTMVHKSLRRIEESTF